MSIRAATYHHGNLRAELLQRAEETIAAEGVDGLSLRQLARDLGVSHGAPSRHFRDKRALLDALAYDGFARMNALMSTAAASAGTIPHRLDTVAHVYVGFAVEHAALLSVMYSTKHAADASDGLREIGQLSLAPTVELLREAQEAGLIVSGDVERLALVSFAAVHGVATLATNQLLEGVPVEEATETTVALLWAGLTVGAARA